MKKILTHFSKYLSLLLLFLLLCGVALFWTVPKAVLLDLALAKANVFLLPREVKEGPLWVRFSDARVFFKGKEVSQVKTLSLDISLQGLRLRALCSGSLQALVKISGEVEANFSNFDCLKEVSSIGGSIKLKEDKLFGKVHIRGINAEGVEIESLSLDFKGKRFRGTIRAMGMVFEGGGTFKLNRADLRRSSVNAQFSGELGRIVLSGSLSNPSVRFISGQ